jgi:hypothetical protein
MAQRPIVGKTRSSAKQLVRPAFAVKLSNSRVRSPTRRSDGLGPDLTRAVARKSWRREDTNRTFCCRRKCMAGRNGRSAVFGADEFRKRLTLLPGFWCHRRRSGFLDGQPVLLLESPGQRRTGEQPSSEGGGEGGLVCSVWGRRDSNPRPILSQP